MEVIHGDVVHSYKQCRRMRAKDTGDLDLVIYEGCKHGLEIFAFVRVNDLRVVEGVDLKVSGEGDMVLCKTMVKPQAGRRSWPVRRR